MKRVGLRLKFAVLFIMVVTVVLGAAGLWSALSQQKQAEKEMLEKAQVLAQEMDAVWTFFETNQHQFKTDERGNYEAVLRCRREVGEQVLHGRDRLHHPLHERHHAPPVRRSRRIRGCRAGRVLGRPHARRVLRHRRLREDGHPRVPLPAALTYGRVVPGMPRGAGRRAGLVRLP